MTCNNCGQILEEKSDIKLCPNCFSLYQEINALKEKERVFLEQIIKLQSQLEIAKRRLMDRAKKKL